VRTSSSVRLPRIGLTAYRETASWGVWNQSADLLPAGYADGVVAAGGAALLLPSPGPGAALDEQAGSVLDGLDGLLLTGGPDVDPARYGADRDERTQAPRPERDAWEIALTHAAIGREMPVLCVCRGLQTLNVALGGTLIQHLPDRVGHDDHSPAPGQYGRHEVHTRPGTRIAQAYGERAEVATYHHQAVEVLAPGLVPTAWADDATIEAAESEGPSWLVAVQWHPEVFNGARLFTDFVAACAERSPASV
jgi:gamma-glutamyl-gamma-aminobutyrate hydrolase PuuD